jgi:transcriptional regulator with XRE-family HTH domain
MEDFGRNVRFYRKQRRLTQTELATLVGVAPAYVSQIESALRMPSLKVARRFAESLDVDLPLLLGTPETSQDADHRSDAEKLETLRGVVRAIEYDLENRPGRPTLETCHGARGLRLTETSEGTVRVFVFQAPAPAGPPDLRWSHPGLERLHCAAGEVRVHLGDDEITVVAAGDDFEFDAGIPHAISGVPDSVLVSTARTPISPDTLRSQRIDVGQARGAASAPVPAEGTAR